jgi:hypothetical protein
MQHKIIVRFQDGRILKGTTVDFMPNKYLFHIMPLDAPPGQKPQEITVRELKAVFFVRDYDGNAQYKERKEFSHDRPAAGRKIKVVFKDEELLVGTTQGYQPDRPGFFVFPADTQSNNERCYVVSSAVKEVSLL